MIPDDPRGGLQRRQSECGHLRIDPAVDIFLISVQHEALKSPTYILPVRLRGDPSPITPAAPLPYPIDSEVEVEIRQHRDAESRLQDVVGDS